MRGSGDQVQERLGPASGRSENVHLGCLLIAFQATVGAFTILPIFWPKIPKMVTKAWLSSGWLLGLELVWASIVCAMFGAYLQEGSRSQPSPVPHQPQSQERTHK